MGGSSLNGKMSGWPVVTEMTLVDQERGKEWEYRIAAINKSGEGEPRNTVMAVLQDFSISRDLFSTARLFGDYYWVKMITNV